MINTYKNFNIRNNNNNNVKKVWLPKEKTWDYILTNEPNWKPSGKGIVTKDDLENISYDEWFNDDILIDYDKVIENRNNITNIIKSEKNSNKFKLKFNMLKYNNILINEYSYNYLINKYKYYNIPIYYITEKLNNIYKIKASMNSLKYRIRLKLPDFVLRNGNNDNYIYINYWIFKDRIIFKN